MLTRMVRRIVIATLFLSTMVGSELIRFIRVIDNNHYESTTPVTDAGNGEGVKIVLTWQRIA